MSKVSNVNWYQTAANKPHYAETSVKKLNACTGTVPLTAKLQQQNK